MQYGYPYLQNESDAAGKLPLSTALSSNVTDQDA